MLNHEQLMEEAAKNFDLPRLKRDMEKYQNISERPWQIMVAILAGLSVKEIAKTYSLEVGAVKTERDRGLKDSLKEILQIDRIPWDTHLRQKLINAGYGIKQDHDQPKFNSKLSTEIFKQVLERKIKKLTSDFLINTNFDSKVIYVPLGLIERKEKSKYREVTPEKGSALYRANEYEISREFENDQFLTEVLLDGNSPKSQGQKIAIIGEPGSGKSTRLQQIALWLVEQSPENNVIWISLADLRGHSLEDYLLKVWLKYALNKRETSEADQDELVEIFNQGNVWLLLDGIDEMGLSENPLAWVNRQLQGWINQAKIIVTCRINVWDGNRQALNQFYVYRNLDFSDDQRNKFIIKFLDNPELSDGLINELGQLGKERISDLVRNPLRLTLICRSWQKRQGALPETKAGVYQECIDAYYDWKEEPKTTKAQRKELHKALGELAKQALDSNCFRFRLTESQVSEVLGESDEGLFKLALDLGWLNEIGEAEENHEKIYAFLHPSFQEYFAAATIDNWDFFLPHEHTDQPIRNKKYRIFDSQWREVILMWLGRRDIEDEHKNRFIYKIVSFDDGCNDFYKHQALYLATIGLSSYPNCPFTEVIIDRSIFYAFGYADLSTGRWQEFFDHISYLAYQSLLTSYHPKVSDRLIKFYFSIDNKICFQDEELFIEMLAEIANTNSYSMEAFLRLASETREGKTRKSEILLNLIIENIDSYCKSNVSAISFVVDILNSLDISEYTEDINVIIRCLGSIAEGNTQASTALKRIVNESRDEEMVADAAESLGRILELDLLIELIEDLKISGHNYIPTIIDSLCHGKYKIITAKTRDFKDRSISTKNNYKPINLDKFLEFIQQSWNPQQRYQAEQRLRNISNTDARKIYPILCNTILMSQEHEKINFAYSIITKEIIKKNVIKISEMQDIISILKTGVEQTNSNNYRLIEKCHEIIWECAKTLSYPDFYKAWYGDDGDRLNQDYNQCHQIVIETKNLNSITDKIKLLERFRKRLLNSIPIEISSKIQTLINDKPQTNDTRTDDLIDQIEDIILAIKKELQVEKLDLFLDSKNPSQLVLDLREKFSDLVKIDWNR